MDELGMIFDGNYDFDHDIINTDGDDDSRPVMARDTFIRIVGELLMDKDAEIERLNAELDLRVDYAKECRELTYKLRCVEQDYKQLKAEQASAVEAERERCKAILGKAATMARDAAGNVEKGSRHIGQSYKQHMNDCADLINKIAEELFPKEADNG